MRRLYLAGRRGSGKTTAAQILARRYDAKILRVTEPLYEIARSYFDMREKDRLLLQRIGDAFRAVDPAWLAKHAAYKAACRAGLDGAAVIEGVRTPEEADWLNNHGWVGILITAPASDRLARRAGEPAEVDAHLTETAVGTLPVAVRVENPGTMEGFEEALMRVVSAMWWPLIDVPVVDGVCPG